jgi:hypothetical protein
MEDEPRRFQELPKTPGDEEIEGNAEITVSDIAGALVGNVPDEDIHENIDGKPVDEALGNAFTLLLENGIPDPEQFLIEKGILE